MQYDVYGKINEVSWFILVDYACDMPYLLPIDVDSNKAMSNIIAVNKIERGIYSYSYFDEDEDNIKLKELKTSKINLLMNPHPIVKTTGNKKLFDFTTDRTFRDSENLCYKGVPYPITYKYNTETNRHELYIDYIADENDINSLDDAKVKVAELNKMIEDFNKQRDKEIKELEEYINRTWFTKLKNKLKGVKLCLRN